MERKMMIDILNGMCERCLIKGIITTIDDAKRLCDIFDRFCKNNYINDEEYSGDVLYLYNLAVRLHESGNTSLEESYSIYNAILNADKVDFVKTDKIDNEKSVNVEPVKLKRNNKMKENSAK